MAVRANDGANRQSVTAVLRLVRALSTQAERFADQVRSDLGMHRSDLTAMGVISDNARDEQELTPSELAHELHLSASAVTSLLDRLERVGHIQRARHAGDRRKVVVEITPEAAQLSAAAFRPLSEAIRSTLATRSDEELAVLTSALADMVEAMAKACETRSPIAGPDSTKDAQLDALGEP